MSLLPKLPVSAGRAMRFALAIGILGLLVLKLNNAKPFERLAATKPIFVLLAISVLAIEDMARAWNWTKLIRGMYVAPRVGYGTVLRIYWMSGFLGQFVLAGVGTDALRAVMATRSIGGHPSAQGAAVVMLNVIGLTVSCAAALVCAAWLALAGHHQGVRMFEVVLYAGVIVAAVVGYWLLHWQRGAVLRLLRLMPVSLEKSVAVCGDSYIVS